MFPVSHHPNMCYRYFKYVPFKIFYYFKNCVCVCMYVQCLWRPEEGVRLTGMGVTGSPELSDEGTVN